MARRKNKAAKTTALTSLNLKSFALIVVFLLLAFLLLQFGSTGPGLKTSLIKTSYNRLSSTVVNTTIPDPGRLSLSIGPTSYLGDANLFAIELTSSEAIPLNSPPFTLGVDYVEIFNAKNTNNPNTLVLVAIFPEGHFDLEEKVIAELPFRTFNEGQFDISSIYFGNIPTNSFPSYQDYTIFIESSNLPFDELGAAKFTASTFEPPPPPEPKCSDQLDNDGDTLIDYPADPGCENPLDNDEIDPEGPASITLDIPADYLTVIRKLDLSTEYLAILPPAQEQLRYEFTLQAQGGLDPEVFSWGVRGRTPDSNGVFAFENSGLVLTPSGTLSGEPNSLKAGNYLYQFTVSDGEQTLNFGVQIAVHDAFGNPVGLIMDTSLKGGEQECVVNEVCEAFFRATKGISPYLYAFSGEAPDVTTFLQVNAGEAFYRFIPSNEQAGSYNMSISVTDNSEQTEAQQETDSRTRASIDFTLTILEEEIESSFKFSAERNCEFLDLSHVDEAFDYFQFTCRNGIMEGYQGSVRAFDFFNRAEAAKVTNLIVADEEQVAAVFEPFVGLPPATKVNYDDVTVGDWYSSFVYYLFTKGIIIDNDVYRPADTLTVAEAMKLVVEAHAELNSDLRDDLDDLAGARKWFAPYRTIASYVDALIASSNPGLPAERVLIAELIYKLNRDYPTDKFQ